MSHQLDLAASLWFAAQDGSAARMVRDEFLRLSRENADLCERVQHMAAGFPDGVSREEWDILKQLRETMRIETKGGDRP